MKKALAAILVSVVLFMPSLASAAESFGASAQGTPSVLYYTWDGMWMGATAGLSIAHLGSPMDGKNYANSVGIGALLGMGGGITLGIMDARKGRKGYGMIILRDMKLGATIGMVAGALVGGLDGVNNNKWESVGKDSSIGYLGGMLLGMGIGFYEGPIIVKNYTSTMQVGPVMMVDSHDMPCPGFGVVTRF